jgi:tetratricopeptide (TPR) repeat protein
MRTRRFLLGTTAAAATVLAVFFGGVLGGGPSAETPVRQPVRAGAAASQLLQGFSVGDTAAYVRELENRVGESGGDVRSLALLGLAYQQRARETGDPSFLSRSERALRRAEALAKDDYLVTTGLASLAATRHRFREALTFARRAIARNPYSAAAYGILGDALVELGRYREGFAAYDRMTALKPTLASYARVAYGRELLGRPRAAIAAMKLAANAGASRGENAAWALVQLGNLYFDTGAVASAERAYREALWRFPGYVDAEAGLARVEASRGRTNRAVALYRAALERMPLPEFAAGLTATLLAAGRTKEAREVDGLVDVIQRRLEANGVQTDLDAALYDLDRGRRLGDALARSRQAFTATPGIEAEHVLAWALYKNRRCAEARAHSIRALRLGTRDALMHFHRGMIERCLGNRRASRTFLAEALAINPHFSPLYGPVAREALQ